MRQALDMFVVAVETMNEYIGRAMGWLMLGLVLLVALDVASRKIFNTGWVAVQEAEWWIFSVIFLMGAGYTFLYQGHVRVDILYSRASPRRKDWIDLSCAFIFLFPLCTLVIWSSLWFIEDSWKVGEYSPDPGGLPFYYVLKSFIPLGFFLLALQGLAGVVKILKRLASEPVPDEGEKVQ